MPTPTPAPPARLDCVGIGWRQPHYAALQAEGGWPADLVRPAFLEVHSENFFAPGGAALQALMGARASFDISLHGVGLSLGSACGLDAWHLDRLAALVQRVDPVRVSDHASFARVAMAAGAVHGSDLLPIAFTGLSLAIMVRHVQQVQERLGRRLLVENLSAYLRWQGDTLAEVDFFNALTRQSGCGLLLDVNNLMVNALNRGAAGEAAVAQCCAWIDALDPGAVGEIHLAGYAELGDIVIDDHGSRVRPGVWQVYRHALARLGPQPSLIEWDTDVPALPVLMHEAALAQRCVDELARAQAGVVA
jgi:uncharacterized protein (UPF0276 family)